MLSKKTWPNFKGAIRQAAEHIIDAAELKPGVAFGNTKIFIKEPKTLFSLEVKREAAIPGIVAKIQVSAYMIAWHA